MSGGLGNDNLSGGAGNDVLVGDAGNDVIAGDAGNDVLFGGAGDDSINGGDGDDIIVGDLGNDTFTASAGFDTYRFGFGDGQDTYIGSEAKTINGSDVVELESNINKEALWFERVGNDLVMKLLGSTDSITFKSWYQSSDAAKNWHAPNDAKQYVYGFVAGDEILTFNKVHSLVTAMANLTPNDGQTAYGVTATNLPDNLRTAVNSAWASVA
jgi:Ca2+-binding RTX toxin-like protein